MLWKLQLSEVGPAADLGPVEFGERLSVLTGDNGLGKTLLLDVAWWCLSGTWVGRPAIPRDKSLRVGRPRIQAVVAGKTKPTVPITARYNYTAQDWRLAGGRPAMPGLVLYFRVDGRFSVWDPVQHYFKRSRAADSKRAESPEALSFGSGEAWDTIRDDDGKVICRGLIEDWVTWQQTASREFELLKNVLRGLSEDPEHPLLPGDPKRVWLDDRRLYPTLELPYGRTPVTLASAAVQRIVLMAYLLVWAWQEHRRESDLQEKPAEKRLVLLFDEPETHLHPQWQRRIVPALLNVVNQLREELQLQLIISTHSPLVLASLEPDFDSEIDAFLQFDWNDRRSQATLERAPFAKRGDVLRWLAVQGLAQARSVPAGEAIEAAKQFMRGRPSANPRGLRTRKEIDARLRAHLPDSDSFWPRWVAQEDEK